MQTQNTMKPKYPIRIKPTMQRCTQWDLECPASARVFLDRMGLRYFG